MSNYNSRAALRFGYCLLSVTILAAALQANSFTAGDPTAPPPGGVLNLTVTLPDGVTQVVIPPINVPDKTGGQPTTAAQKATLIFNALKAANVPNLGYIGANTVTAAGSTIAQTGDTTGEKSKISDSGFSFPGSPAYASLGFDGSLTATAADGSESIFTASFGVDDSIFASASITYGELTTPTADGLMTALYYELLADLSPGLQPDLSLNPSTDTITFDFAPGSGDYFVETSTTSPGTSSFMGVGGVSSAPEPFTWLSLGTGLILLGTCRKKFSRI